MGSELECGGRTFASKSSGFLEFVNLLDQSIRVSQVGNISSEGFIQTFRCLHQACEIFRQDIRGHVDGLKLRVDVMLSGVPLGIRADPPVVLNGGVEWLSAVGHIVPQPSGIKDDRLLDRLRRLAGSALLAIFAERGLQAAIDLYRDVGLQADVLRKVIVRVLAG